MNFTARLRISCSNVRVLSMCDRLCAVFADLEKLEEKWAHVKQQIEETDGALTKNVRKTWLKFAARNHPDKIGSCFPGDHEAFAGTSYPHEGRGSHVSAFVLEPPHVGGTRGCKGAGAVTIADAEGSYRIMIDQESRLRYFQASGAEAGNVMAAADEEGEALTITGTLPNRCTAPFLEVVAAGK